MSTPVPPQPGPQEVAALVDAHPGWWAAAARPAAPAGSSARAAAEAPPGDPPSAPTRVSLLGRGESYTAWRAVRGDAELAVRVPHRPLSELPQPMRAEHDLLTRLPEDVGAHPVAVHEPTPADPAAYLVTSVVPGEVLAPRDWTDDLLAALADQLARLHVLGRLDDPVPAVDHDLLAAARGARDWWLAHEPEAASTLEHLWPAVERHQRRVQELAPDVATVLVHGDTCLTNVVVDGARPRLIDWEWAGPGDAARDLAYAGGRVHADPWYADLDDTRVRRQVQAYAAARDRLGSPVDVEQLLVRRAGWLVHETFFVTPHLRRVAARGGPEAGRYARMADRLQDGLRAWLTSA